MTIARPIIRTRPRAPPDLPAICKLLEKQQPTSGYPEFWPPPCTITDFIVRDTELAAFVAEIDGELVGHVAIAEVEDDHVQEGSQFNTVGFGKAWSEAYNTTTSNLRCLTVLFIDHERAGCGVGSHLIEAAVQHIRAEGAYPVLDTIKTRPEIVSFYERRGWVTIAEKPAPWHPNVYVPLVLMIRPEFIKK